MIRALTLLFLLLLSARAAEAEKHSASYSWGLVSALRTATVPYASPYDDPLLNSYVLLLYLDTPVLFLNGTEGGIRLYRDDAWELAAYGAIHFVDMPRHDPEYFTDDTADLGIMASCESGAVRTDVLLLSDPAWRTHLKLRIGSLFEYNGWEWRPYATAEFKSAVYNSYYFGEERNRIGADIGIETGAEARVFLTEDFALTANVNAGYLGSSVAAADTTDSAFQGELYLGAGVFQSAVRTHRAYKPRGYVRLGFGEATSSSFTQTLSGEGARDLHHLYMVSLAYGLPLSKTLFGTGIHSYFTPGFAHHFASKLQPPTQEYFADFKFFYPLQNWWLRFGFGTGLSYIIRTTYIERYINTKDGYDHTSHLMQNLDISFDFELNRLFGSGWKNLWFGYALHHRSGVFESAHQYGQIKGGSNYNMLYIQQHFTP